MRWGGLVVAVLLVPSASADWLQALGDGAGSNRVEEEGPSIGEIAWRVQLPGSRALFSTALVVGRDAYVATANEGFEGLTTEAIFRIGLDDARIDKLVDVVARPSGFAIHEGAGIVCGDRELAAYALGDGRELWRVALPLTQREHRQTQCGVVVAEGIAFAVATEQGPHFVDPAVANPLVQERVANPPWNYPLSSGSILAVDIATGEPRWSWTHPLESRDPTAAALPQTNPVWGVVGGSVASDHLIVPMASGIDEEGIATWQLWAFHLDGAAAWHHEVGESDPGALLVEGSDSRALSLPASSGAVVFARNGSVLSGWNVATGVHLGDTRILGATDIEARGTPSLIGLDEDGVLVQSSQTLYRFPQSNLAADPTWTLTLPPESGEAWAAGVLVAGSVRIVRTNPRLLDHEPVRTIVRGVDGADGRPAWSLDVASELTGRQVTPTASRGGSPWLMSTSSGVVLLAGLDGSLFALGRTAASIDARASISETFPAPGQEVRVDMGGSRPGLGGAPTEFMAEWGDGVATPWQASPVLSHAYTDAGDRRAVFSARNGAGQMSAQEATVRVGAPKPNLLSDAFAPGNQDVTFFVIGLTITGAVGLFGIVRAQRRDALFRRELRAADAEAERLRESPHALDRALHERRTRAHALLIGRRVSESQHDALAKRIDALVRENRQREIDDRLRFLPYGVVQDLREALLDGRVTRLERTHLVEVVSRQADLTSEQKARTIEAIESWYNADRTP